MPPLITRLPSGLTIISDPMPDVPSASLGLWFGVGTRFERPDEGGLSHLLEHMFFKGTATRTVKELNQAIENVGGNLNAYTSREQTAYQARVLGEDVPLALDLLSDMMLNAKFDEADLVREKGVIASEIGEAHDAPDDWIFDLFQLTAYPDQPLGLPVLGNVESLKTITRAQLLGYVGTHYRAGQCVLAAAGAVDHAQIVKLAEQGLAALPAGQGPASAPARYVGGDTCEARETDQLHLCFGLKGVTYGHPLYYAQNLFAMALGGGTSSRLFHEIREERALAYTVSAFMTPYNDDGLMMVYLATDPEHANEAAAVALSELRDMGQTLTQAELDRARALTRASLLMGMESTENRAERLANNWLQYGRLPPMEETLAALDAVTLADIRSYADLMLQSPLTRAAVGPTEGLEDFAAATARLRG